MTTSRAANGAARGAARASRTAPDRCRRARPTVIASVGSRHRIGATASATCDRRPRRRRAGRRRSAPRARVHAPPRRRRCCACAKPSSGCVGLPNTHSSSSGFVGVDLAGVLHRAAERQRVAFAAEHRELVELRRDSAAPARPAKRWRVLRSYHAPGGSAISTSPPARTIGATSSASPHMNCVSKSRASALPGNASGIARITGRPVRVASRDHRSRYGISR